MPTKRDNFEKMDDLNFSTSPPQQPPQAAFDDHLPLSGVLNQEFSRSSYFSLNYYKRYFNISTDDITSRIKHAINPVDKKFLTTNSAPELYGTLWSTITALFISMIFGNLSAWKTYGNAWRRNISSMVTASIFCFFYLVGSPIAYKFLAKASEIPSFVSLLSLLGYSNLYLIPIAILRFLVGKKIDFLISIAGGIAVAYSIFIKLTAFYNETSNKQKMMIPNLSLAAAAFFKVFVIQYLSFK